MKSILIGLYAFDKPLSASELRDDAGICAILHCQNDRFELIDLIESDNLNSTWQNRRWRYNASIYPGTIATAAHYMNGLSSAERRRVVREIEQEIDMVKALAS